MEAPKCKLCGERHYGLCKVTIYRGWDTEEQEVEVDAVPPTEVRNLSDRDFRVKAKYDRNSAHRAYMKNYMRKRRAKPSPPAE